MGVNNQGKKENKSFFEKNFTFHSVTPQRYRRSEAPRLTAAGGTLNGMHKGLSALVLRNLTERIGGTFIDIDLSACHANVASATQNDHNSELHKLVNVKGNFWSDNATIYQNRISEKGVLIDVKELRAILKVAFYTSLNGGNPFNKNRLSANLKVSAPRLLEGFSSIKGLAESNDFKVIQEEISKFQIISEVTTLNEDCVDPETKQTFTIDREQPYKVNSVHKGISRVLQGFEVILLCHLRRTIKNMGGIPVNLAHDGLLVYFKEQVNAQQICSQAALLPPGQGFFLKEPRSLLNLNLGYKTSRVDSKVKSNEKVIYP